MAYKESYKQAAELAKLALEQMANLEIAPHPDNFEVWYAFRAEVDAELTRKLARLMSDADNSFDLGVYHDIKRDYLGDLQAKLLQSAGADIGATADKVLASLDAASTSTRDYGDALADVSGDLESADVATARHLVAKLMVETQQAIARSTELEAELKASSSKIESLRSNLDDARKASETDGLTGLPNRRSFDLGLAMEFERATTNQGDLSLIIADVDHFKRFNDTYGHMIGDEVLRLVGRVLKSLIKGSDTPARYGGEEFCILLPTTDAKGAFIVAEQVRNAIASKSLKSARTGESYGNVTLSFGCAALRADDTPESLYERADAALYQAKRDGRNRTCSEFDLESRQKAG